MKAKLIKKKEGWYNLYQDSIGIASTHEELQGYKLSLKNCQVIERGEDYGCKTLTEVQDKHIQSLQQTEWEVEIEMENAFESYRDGTIEPLDIPKLDENECLILKLKSE